MTPFETIVVCLLALILLLLAESERERRSPVIKKYTFCSEKAGNLSGKKLLFLSDLHENRYGKEPARKLIKMLDGLSFDAVLIGGDMITVKRSEPDFEPLEVLLQYFSGKHCPVYYGLGNHEERLLYNNSKIKGKLSHDTVRKVYADRFLKLLKKYGVRLLDKEKVYLNASFSETTENPEMILYGLSVPEEGYKAFRKPVLSDKSKSLLFKDADLNALKTVLIHSPLCFKELAKNGAMLIFSGHFHGGTIRLPFLGGLMTPQYQFFNKYCYGEKTLPGGEKQIVSSGLGTHSINLRLFNPPEIIITEIAGKRENGDRI